MGFICRLKVQMLVTSYCYNINLVRTFTLLIYCLDVFFPPSCQDIINTCTNFFIHS